MALERDNPGGQREQTRALAREIGARSVETLQSGLNRMMSDASATLRWALGALVVLNGGGIAVVVGVHEALGGQLDAVLVFFILGAVIAVLAPLAGAVTALAVSRAMGEAITRFTEVAMTGEMNAASLEAASQIRKRSLLGFGVGMGLGLVALLLFLAGALTLSDGLKGSAQTGGVVQEAVAPVAAMPSAPASPVLPTVTPTVSPSPTSSPTPARGPAHRAMPAAALVRQTPSPAPAVSPTASASPTP